MPKEDFRPILDKLSEFNFKCNTQPTEFPDEPSTSKKDDAVIQGRCEFTAFSIDYRGEKKRKCSIDFWLDGHGEILRAGPAACR